MQAKVRVGEVLGERAVTRANDHLNAGVAACGFAESLRALPVRGVARPAYEYEARVGKIRVAERVKKQALVLLRAELRDAKIHERLVRASREREIQERGERTRREHDARRVHSRAHRLSHQSFDVP